MKTVSMPNFMWLELLSILEAKSISDDRHGPKLYDEISFEIKDQIGEK